MADGVAVLLSGRGSNLAALLAAGIDVRLVVSDRGVAAGLAVARAAGVRTAVLEPAAFPDDDAHQDAVVATLAACAPRLVVLAGYMRVILARICARHFGWFINLHPSLLPVLPGRATHKRALAAGHAEHGCSVHWLTGVVDGGPVIRQSRLAVTPGETPAGLRARVRELEHRLLPAVVTDILAGRVVPPPAAAVAHLHGAGVVA